jgi:hypothetical protein
VKHLSPERIFELGLDPSLELTTNEAEHLDDCPVCSRELELERRLSEELLQLPQPEVPPWFAAQTTARYQSVLRKRRLRRAASGMAAALLLGNVAALALVAVLVLNGGAVAHGVGSLVQNVVTFGHAFVVVASKIPLIPVLLTGAVSGTVLVLSTGLGRLALVGARTRW